jgi:hypothetical protein
MILQGVVAGRALPYGDDVIDDVRHPIQRSEVRAL